MLEKKFNLFKLCGKKVECLFKLWVKCLFFIYWYLLMFKFRICFLLIIFSCELYLNVKSILIFILC